MMTPARFEDEIKRIVESDDSILDQIEAYNRLTEDTLRSLGYGGNGERRDNGHD